MTRTKLHPYTCPRCGYKTGHKGHMQRHLFEKKDQCGTIIDDIDLTDEIKQHIVKYRVYKPKKDSTINTVINQYNQYNNVQNIINNIDPTEKLDHYMSYKGLQLIGFSDSVEMRYNEQATKFARDMEDAMELLKEDNMLDVIEMLGGCTRSNSNDTLTTHNILYDKKVHELRFFDYGSWNNMAFDQGVQYFVKKVKEHLFDKCEIFILQSITKSRSARQKAFLREKLESYYKFIACFRIEPYCKDVSDNAIMNEDTGIVCSFSDDSSDNDCSVRITHNIEEEFYPMYDKIKESIKPADVKRVMKRVNETIKRSSSKTVDKLDRLMTLAFKMDDEFRKVVISKLGLSDPRG